MTRNSKQTIDTAAQVLNKHLTSDTPIGKLLTGPDAQPVLGLINEILKKVAEGGRLVAAVESTGELLGYVPSSVLQIPGVAEDPRTPSPDDK